VLIGLVVSRTARAVRLERRLGPGLEKFSNCSIVRSLVSSMSITIL
jgi:hypothetical protein